jgi:hypothetical protein
MLNRKKKIVFPNIISIEQVIRLLANISMAIKWKLEVDIKIRPALEQLSI